MSALEQVAQALQHHQPAALFYQELAATLRPAGLTGADLDTALADMEGRRQIVTTRYPAPDRHLEGLDLRVIALVVGGQSEGEAAAMQASEQVWSDWLRQFLANHRCQ